VASVASWLLVFVPVAGLGQFSAAGEQKKQDGQGIVSSETAKPASAERPARAPSAKRPELILQAGHTKSINAVAFSPDGRTQLRGKSAHEERHGQSQPLREHGSYGFNGFSRITSYS
jgi:hypothetical protein